MKNSLKIGNTAIIDISLKHTTKLYNRKQTINRRKTRENKIEQIRIIIALWSLLLRSRSQSRFTKNFKTFKNLKMEISKT